MRLSHKRRRSWRQTKSLYQTSVLLAVGCILIGFFTLVRPFHTFNLWLSDQLFLSERPSPNIVVVGIDDDTLETYGKWSSWPRSLHAQAVHNLSSSGARVIGFDVLFSDSSSDDDMLAEAMRSAGSIVLPLVGTQQQPSTDPRTTYAQILLPVSPLQQASAHTGHANMTPDPDGRVRRLPLAIRDPDGQAYPAFGLAVLSVLFGTPLPQEYVRQEGVLRLLARTMPVDAAYSFRINFAPDYKSRPYISYKNVIRGDFAPSTVENKIVLIGMTATGELDKWAVPTSSSRVPGVFIQATVIDNILRQQFLTDVGAGVDLAIMLLLVGITGFALPRVGPRKGGLLSGALFAGYLVATFIMFEDGYILNLLYPLSTLPVVYVSSIVTQNVTTTIENARLHRRVADGYKDTIRALAASIDAKDPYTRGHSQRVTEYAILGAISLSMSQEDLEILEYAGILHDIGKIGIPDSILR
ncbi:MAG: CHASE2 domain-containing protein, partial [Chloroflexota bacterium]